jgi:O-antigen/teichoic acid export membrane protein
MRSFQRAGHTWTAHVETGSSLTPRPAREVTFASFMIASSTEFRRAISNMAPFMTESSRPVVAQIYARMKRAVESVLLGDSLRAKVFRGGAWLGAGSVVEQAARFGRNMLLTRLLAPEAFGEMAIVLAAGSMLQSFTDIGVREGLVQHRSGGEDHFVETAWWLGLGRAISLAAVLYAVAPLVARFYGNIELTALLRLSTLGIVLGGASSPRAYVAMKEMKFGKLAAIANMGGICGVAITVVLSFVIRDVWALVIGSCAESAARCAISYLVCPYFPSLRWNKEASRDLLRFSKGLFGLSFLNLIFARADIFVLAKFYSPAELGLYTMAIYLVQTPTTFIMNMLGQTLMPAFSQIQDDVRRTNRVLVQVTTLIWILGLPVLVFVFFCGRSVLTLAYGQRYGSLTGALCLASCVALANLLNGQITTVFYARGIPHLHRSAVAAMAIAMAVAIYPLARWLGPVGGQVACLLAVMVGYVLQVLRVRRLIGLDLTLYSKGFLIATLASMSVVAVSLSGLLLVVLARPVFNITLGIVGCLLAYVIGYAILLRHRIGLSARPLQVEL